LPIEDHGKAKVIRLSRDGAPALEAKALVAAVAKRLRFLDTYAFLKRKHIGSQVVIATYHRISLERDDWSRTTLSPQAFETQIRYFRENFQILSLDQLLSHLLGDKSLPRRVCVITFDDGYRDNYVYALPILRKYAVPATFFLTTGHIGINKPFWWDEVGYLVHHAVPTHLELEELGSYPMESASDRRRANLVITGKLNDLPEERKNTLIERLADISRVNIPADMGKQLILSWEEVEEMSQKGAQFGAHSMTHATLTNLPLEQAKWEIRQSKEGIEERLGRKVSFFSYPDGRFNSEIVEIVRETGFAAAATTDPKWITPKSDVYRLGRISMIEDSNKSAALLCGLRGDLMAVSGLRKRQTEQ
jgi:peptidoglycan/xylan/chitin deacetylase (PgdA/CDA1 family)